MLTVYRASAGAGKTHRLTGEYLTLLFTGPGAFRRILAVTFTNKATDEMKTRIICELYNLASGEKSDYIELLISNSMIDSSISMYLYNKYLLSNEIYINHLKENINYLIVDSLENCNSAEVDFISKLMDFTNEAYLYINETKDYASFNNVDKVYIQDKLFNRCEIIDNYNIDKVDIKEI